MTTMPHRQVHFHRFPQKLQFRRKVIKVDYNCEHWPPPPRNVNIDRTLARLMGTFLIKTLSAEICRSSTSSVDRPQMSFQKYFHLGEFHLKQLILKYNKVYTGWIHHFLNIYLYKITMHIKLHGKQHYNVQIPKTLGHRTHDLLVWRRTGRSLCQAAIIHASCLVLFNRKKIYFKKINSEVRHLLL
jgi:hypothetical protein